MLLSPGLCGRTRGCIAKLPKLDLAASSVPTDATHRVPMTEVKNAFNPASA